MKVCFGDFISSTTIQKIDMENIELELDNMGKIVAIVFYDANERIVAQGNMTGTSHQVKQ